MPKRKTRRLLQVDIGSTTIQFTGASATKLVAGLLVDQKGAQAAEGLAPGPLADAIAEELKRRVEITKPKP